LAAHKEKKFAKKKLQDTFEILRDKTRRVVPNTLPAARPPPFFLSRKFRD
jgi:hypothetical protein